MIWRLQTAILLLTQKCVTASVDLKVMVKYSVDSTIQGEYIGCCHVVNQVLTTVNNKAEAAKLIVSECIQQGYLVDFLNKHKVEVISMFESLFDEKTAQEAHDNEIREEGREEGIKTGLKEGIKKGREEGIAALIATLTRLHTPRADILPHIMREFTLTLDQAEEYYRKYVKNT